MGIDNYAGIIIVNNKGQILLVRKLDDYAYAIPWCRIQPGEAIQDCLKRKVKDLTGLSVEPAFLEPNEHIEEDSHQISFDHLARIDGETHHYVRDDLDYIWMKPGDFQEFPLVPLTRNIIERYLDRIGFEVDVT